MKITIVGRQLNVWDEMKATIEAKLGKLSKYFDDSCAATATLSSTKKEKCMEITIISGGTIFRSEIRSDTFRNALDRAVEHIERQIRKNKTRLAKRLRSGAFDSVPLDVSEEIEEEAEFDIRRKRFAIKPMSAEEAIMQMNLLGHDFFIFRNDTDERIAVVYKRHDNTYGLIEEE